MPTTLAQLNLESSIKSAKMTTVLLTFWRSSMIIASKRQRTNTTMLATMLIWQDTCLQKWWNTKKLIQSTSRRNSTKTRKIQAPRLTQISLRICRSTTNRSGLYNTQTILIWTAAVSKVLFTHLILKIKMSFHLALRPDRKIWFGSNSKKISNLMASSFKIFRQVLLLSYSRQSILETSMWSKTATKAW